MATKDDLKQIMDNFIDPDMYIHFLIMDGKKIEADIAYTKVYKTAKKSIYIVDNYIGLKTIELFINVIMVRLIHIIKRGKLYERKDSYCWA